METEENSCYVWCGRPIKCELNVLSKPEGSAILSQGNTVVVASVYGPYELKHGKIQTDDVAFQVQYKTKIGPPGNDAKLKEDLIKSAAESVFFQKNFARHEITLNVQENQDAGGLLCCAINAACLAMMNAGIEMQHLIAAVRCCLTVDGKIVIDPSDCAGARMLLDVAFDSVKYNIVMINSEGSCSREEYLKAVSECRAAAKDLIEYFRSVVKKYSTVLFNG